MPISPSRRVLSLVFASALVASIPLTGLALGQGKGPNKGGGGGGKKDEVPAESPVKVTVNPPPKEVDEAIAKNAERMKKESDLIKDKTGNEMAGACGVTVAFRAEEPQERVNQLAKLGDAMVFEMAADLELDPVKDLWTKSAGQFNMFCFKTKSSFGDAHREFLEKKFPSHNLEPNRKRHMDIGRFIASDPSPLAAGEIDQYEHSLAHWLGQQVMHQMSDHGAPAHASKAAKLPEITNPEEKAKRDKAERELREGEQRSWLSEGFAIYASVRFVGANRTYCVTDTRYVGKMGMADKDLDTAYRLVCLEMAQGEEDKAKDFTALTKTENNSLNYLDLAKSWSFCDWMMRPENRAKFTAILAGMPRYAFVTSLKLNGGMTMQQLEDEWKKYVLAEYGGKKKTAPDPKAADPKAKGKPEPKDPKKK